MEPVTSEEAQEMREVLEKFFGPLVQSWEITPEVYPEYGAGQDALSGLLPSCVTFEDWRAANPPTYPVWNHFGFGLPCGGLTCP